MLYACIPHGVPAFATTCVTAFAGAALLFVPFRARLAAAPRDLLRHCLLLVAMGAFETAIVAPAVAIVYPEVDSVFLAWAVFGNTAGFPILLGIPLSILLQEELDIQPAGRSGAAPDDPRGDREPRRRSPGTPESPAP